MLVSDNESDYIYCLKNELKRYLYDVLLEQMCHKELLMRIDSIPTHLQKRIDESVIDITFEYYLNRMKDSEIDQKELISVLKNYYDKLKKLYHNLLVITVKLEVELIRAKIPFEIDHIRMNELKDEAQRRTEKLLA